MVLKWSPQSSHHEEGTNPLILKGYELIKTIKKKGTKYLKMRMEIVFVLTQVLLLSLQIQNQTIE